MTDEEQRAYSKGYYAGRHVAELVRRVEHMRAQVDTFRCFIDPDDEWAVTLGQLVSACDHALDVVCRRLSGGGSQDPDQPGDQRG